MRIKKKGNKKWSTNWNDNLCFVWQDDDDQKVAIMRKAFQMFDTAKTGFIDTLKISTILNTMGQLFDDNELQGLIEENDAEGEYEKKKNIRKRPELNVFLFHRNW